MTRLCSILVALWCVSSADVLAAPIVFVHSGSGPALHGSLDGQPFTVTSFQIVAEGDTDDRQHVDDGTPLGFSVIEHSAATISLPGLGVYTFVTPTLTFVNNNSALVGFSRNAIVIDLFNGPTAPAFTAWDMSTGIGPISGAAELLQWFYSDVLTTGGVLRFDDAPVSATFSATVPEPATLLPIVLLTGLAASRARSRSRR